MCKCRPNSTYHSFCERLQYKILTTKTDYTLSIRFLIIPAETAVFTRSNKLECQTAVRIFSSCYSSVFRPTTLLETRSGLATDLTRTWNTFHVS